MSEENYHLNQMGGQTIRHPLKIENDSMEICSNKFGNYNTLHSQIPSTSQLTSVFPTTFNSFRYKNI